MNNNPPQKTPNIEALMYLLWGAYIFLFILIVMSFEDEGSGLRLFPKYSSSFITFFLNDFSFIFSLGLVLLGLSVNYQQNKAKGVYKVTGSVKDVLLLAVAGWFAPSLLIVMFMLFMDHFWLLIIGIPLLLFGIGSLKQYLIDKRKK